jgi:hypothetical protein
MNCIKYHHSLPSLVGECPVESTTQKLKNSFSFKRLASSVADPDPGSSGMGKKSRSGTGMHILDQISESLGTIFGLKFLKSLIRKSF